MDYKKKYLKYKIKYLTLKQQYEADGGNLASIASKAVPVIIKAAPAIGKAAVNVAKLTPQGKAISTGLTIGAEVLNKTKKAADIIQKILKKYNFNEQLINNIPGLDPNFKKFLIESLKKLNNKDINIDEEIDNILNIALEKNLITENNKILIKETLKKVLQK
jgi:hypothetical protein